MLNDDNERSLVTTLKMCLQPKPTDISKTVKCFSFDIKKQKQKTVLNDMSRVITTFKSRPKKSKINRGGRHS